MNSRSITTIIFSIIMIVLVMGVSLLFSFNGSAAAEKYSANTRWNASYSTAESMKIIDLTGDGVDDLFIQSLYNASIYDGNGTILQSWDITSAKSTMGDVNGDGVEDVVIYQVTSPNVVIISKGQMESSFDVSGMSTPSRVTLMKFSSGTQLVLGDDVGNLQSFDPDGTQLWKATVGYEEIRGLDDTRINGQVFLAAASHSGEVGVVDASGNFRWKNSTEQLRRMRAYDLYGDGTSEILTGGEYGDFSIWNADDGTKIFSKTMGQAVSEIRTAEINGDPSSIEIIVGGKDGGLWAFDATGKQLWSHTLSDKVTEIVGADFNDDGHEELIVGDDSGQVSIFSGSGNRSNLKSYTSGITRLDEGRLNNERVVAIASNYELEIQRVEYSDIPGFQFVPLLVGLIVSGAIAAVAWILATMPKKPEMKVSIQDKSRESLEAERRMLKESIADVERLRKSGEVVGDAYLARLKQLRGDLAENETAFKEAGFPIKVETIKCPNCGGMLELGMDKCEYCGHVILA